MRRMAGLLEFLTVRLGVAGLLTAALLLLSPGPASAEMVVTVQSVNALPGTSNDAFDLFLTNTGPSAVQVGGFAVGVSVAGGSGITFAAANISTTTVAPYIFDGLGLVGSDIGTLGGGGLSITASDLFSVIGSGTTMGSGSSVGLAHVLFNVSSGASPGPVTVVITPFPTTNLSNFNGENVPITTLNNGTITIGVVAIPEPSTSVLALVGMGLVGCRLGWKRWVARRSAV